MCVAALAWHAHPRWRLVAIGNRDEFHDRPAVPLKRWADGSGIVAGRDLIGGGTWLGLGDAGRFALITNRRGFGDPDPTRRSRGELVTAMLAGAEPPAPLAAYNAFSLLAASSDQLEFLTNRPQPLRTALAHGVYGLSNGALDEAWPKTLALKAAVTDWLSANRGDFDALFTALTSQDWPKLGLPAHEPSDIPVEPRDTPPFIRSSLYGTRCSTVVTIDYAGYGVIVERRFDRAGREAGETRIAVTS